MSRHACTTSSPFLTLVTVALALGGSAAQAAIYTVGNGAGCNYTSIAAALAASAAHPEDSSDAIHLASNMNYTQQAITVTTGKFLEIAGGFATCAQTQADGSHVVIDGAGGSANPVFRITLSTNGRVQLYNLTIQGGDPEGSGRGGGIYFKGSGDGSLRISHCEVTNNTAGYGGGIYAEGVGTGSGGILGIGPQVAIVGNTARFDGGGIVTDGTFLSMSEGDSYIANNHAPNGYGGGLLVLAGTQHTLAQLRGTGLGNLGLIYLNNASRGGGIAVMGSDSVAQLNLSSSDPTRPARIKGNSASLDGGGIYLGRAGGAVGQSTLFADNVSIEDNVAPHGAAISVRESAGADSGVFFNKPDQGSSICPAGKPCASISGNAAIDNASELVGGVVEASSDASVSFNRTAFEGNIGKFVYFGSIRTNFNTNHVAITGNTVSDNLIAADNEGDSVDIENTTIADNSIGNFPVLRLRSSQSSPSKLYRSIIWQPFKTTLHLIGDSLDVIDDLVSEGTSVDGDNSPNLVVRDPRFVDPGHNDYSLRASSPAVDYTSSVAGDDLDLYSKPRDVDLPIVANANGKRDLGAIERQTLQPLVLDSDFDVDLRLWSVATAGVTTWDGTRNASGATGSGSAHITRPSAVTGTQTAGLVQCVHLPGPGTYALNGWGHGTGTNVTAGDIAELAWEYRKNGGENCALGAADLAGTKILSSGNSWSRPATPVTIEVTEQDWTPTSSIAVTLIAVENGASGAPTNAWFDGITVAVEGDDTIFADGFE